MLSRANRSAVSILRPSVLAALVYFALCAIWFLWILVTLRHPPLDSYEAFRLITPGQYLALTAANVVFAVAFLVDGWLARSSPPSLRRAHFAGLGLGALTLAVLQYGAVCARGPIPPSRSIEPSEESLLASILADVAAENAAAGKVLTVAPRTMWYRSFREEPAESKDSMLEDLAERSPRVAEAREDVRRLLDALWDKNRSTAAISLPSRPEAGYEIDTDWRMEEYFTPTGGGWQRWYEDNPDSGGSAGVSLPVHDPATGLVLVYFERVSHGLEGGGWVVLFEYDGERYEELARALVWIS